MGSNRLKAYRITDFVIPAIILQNEIIAKDLYEDGYSFVLPDVIRDFWIGVRFEDKGTIACYRMVQIGAVHWQGHAHVMPDYRNMSEECTKTATLWGFENVPLIEKLTTIIPVTCPNVIKHIEAIGFKKVGTLEKSYMKNKELVDQEIHSIDKKTVLGFR